MPNFNRVILMGNLTRDPELRYTPNGQAVADLRIAINRRSRGADGERRDNTTFVDVTAWGRQAEVINEYFTKGRPIFIEGRLQFDEWTSSDGQRRSKLRVVLEAFEFLSPRGESRPRDNRQAQRDDHGTRTAPTRPQQPQPQRAAPPRPAAQNQNEDESYDQSSEESPFDDDVPF